MFHSLRFRLPALFLAGIALTGVVSTLIAFGLFRNYTQNQARKELRREATGLTALYAQQAVRSQEKGTLPPFFAASRLERASGNKLFYVGPPFFSGQASGLRRLPQSAVDFNAILQGKTIEFEFTPPGENRTFLAVAHPLRLDKNADPFGGLVVATPQAQLSNQAMRLVLRLAIALLVGLLVTAALAWYLSGRITRPVRRLALAADEVAEGRYETQLPEVTGRDEIADLTRIVHADDRAAGRVGRARAELPDDGLPRAADASDGDPRPRRGAPRRARRGSGGPKPLAGRDRGRVGPARAPRRRRPRPGEARHATLHGAPRGGRHGAARRAGLRGVRRGGEVAQDRLLAGRLVGAGDRHRRRPRPADHHEPALRTRSGGLRTGAASIWR